MSHLHAIHQPYPRPHDQLTTNRRPTDVMWRHEHQLELEKFLVFIWRRLCGCSFYSLTFNMHSQSHCMYAGGIRALQTNTHTLDLRVCEWISIPYKLCYVFDPMNGRSVYSMTPIYFYGIVPSAQYPLGARRQKAENVCTCKCDISRRWILITLKRGHFHYFIY